MFASSRATVLAAGSLALAIQGGAAQGPCGDINGVMKTVVGMAPECFEKCPDACKPLGSVVTKYLAKEDPWSVVCSDEKAFTCPFQTDACKSLLATASAMDLPVPQSLAELEEKCPAKDKSKAKKSGKKVPASDDPTVASAAAADASDDMNSTTEASADDMNTTANTTASTTASTTMADTTMADTTMADANESSTDEDEGNTTVAPVSAASGPEAPGLFAAAIALAALAA